MPTGEHEANAVAAPPDAEGRVDLDALMAEYERKRAERHKKLVRDARGVFRAMEGWGTIKDAEQWQQTVRKAAEDLETGAFLIDRLGAERYLDPDLMAVLLVLRRRLVDEYGAESAADIMLIDVAVLSYYHTIRLDGWIGNFASLIEHEFFGTQSLSAKLADRYGRYNDKIQGLRVDDYVARIGEQLLPLMDRANRLMLRNLKALQARRQPPGASVSIGSAGQVNVAQAQVNATGRGADRRP
jgi:hypothetical protein